MSQPQRNTDPISALLQEGVALSEEEKQAARSAFLERVENQQAARGGVRALLPQGAAGWIAPALAAAAVVLFIFVWPSDDLSYQVVGAANDGGYVRAAGEPAELRFSDATRLSAAPGARVRIIETYEDGARVSVEKGRLSAHVTHTGSSAWNFEAGPFVVHVTGTRFEMAWDAEAESLRVDLLEGSVEISAYDESGPIALRAGQRFWGEVRSRRMEVSELPPEGAEVERVDEESATADGDPAEASRPTDSEMADSASDAEEAEQQEPVTTEGKSVALPSKPGKSASWGELVTKGKFDEVVRSANARGVASCLSGCRASDLMALADAARYTGNNGLASRSLLSLRERYRSQSGVRAALLLGRLYEGQDQLQQARTWYETSLRESGSGAYAAESLAGKMRATLSLQGRAAAQPIARQYLKSYPHGVHAAAAKKIVEP